MKPRRRDVRRSLGLLAFGTLALLLEILSTHPIATRAVTVDLEPGGASQPSLAGPDVAQALLHSLSPADWALMGLVLAGAALIAVRIVRR